MFCANCGTQLENEAKFCDNCGTSIENGSPARNILPEADQITAQQTNAQPTSSETQSEVEINPKLVWIPSVLAIGVPLLIRQGKIPLPDGPWVDIFVILGILWIFLGSFVLKKIAGKK